MADLRDEGLDLNLGGKTSLMCFTVSRPVATMTSYLRLMVFSVMSYICVIEFDFVLTLCFCGGLKTFQANYLDSQ